MDDGSRCTLLAAHGLSISDYHLGMEPSSRRPLAPALCAGLAVAACAGVVWFGLGMNRGLLLSSDIKARCWPWAPTFPHATHLQAPVLSDAVWQFVPWLQLARHELAAHRLPLWNPHQDGGVPLLGNLQSALASPLLAPALLLGVEDGWNLSLLLRILVAGAGCFLLLRDLGRSRLAAWLGMVGFALAGPFVAWLEATNTLVVAALPWLFLFSRRSARGGGATALLGTVLASFALVAGGHPETAAFCLALVAGVLLAEDPNRRRLLAPAGGAVLGAMLAAPLLLPFLEYYWLSAARVGEGRHAFVLPVAALIRFVLPRADAGNPITTAAAVSLPVLALAVAAPFLQRRRRALVPWAAAAALILLVVYDNPVARLLASHTPLYWTRALVVLPLPLAVLAAAGLDGLRERGLRRLGPRLERAIAAALVGLAAGELLWAAQGVHAVTPAADVHRRTPLLAFLSSDHDVFRVLPLHTFLPPNAATSEGLDDLRGYDALAPLGWRRAREAIGHFTATNTVSDVLEPWNLARGGEALDFWNVKYLLVHPQLPFGAGRLNREFGLDLVEVYSGPDGRVLLNRRVRPRARLSGGGTVTLAVRSPLHWTWQVRSPAGGELVVANPYYPGWEARVDGRGERFAARAGEAVRLVVPSGSHRVELLYRPRSLYAGVLIAVVALLLLAVTLLRLTP
jgi:hypothetical protein